MAVLKLRRKACARCGSLLDLPHTELTECLAANTKETQALLERSRELIEKRAKLSKARHARVLRTAAPKSNRGKRIS